MNLEHATLLFLVVVFIGAEIFRSTRSMRGVIVSADDCSIGPVVLPTMTVKVRLDQGDEVTASLNCCTAVFGQTDRGGSGAGLRIPGRIRDRPAVVS